MSEHTSRISECRMRLGDFGRSGKAYACYCIPSTYADRLQDSLPSSYLPLQAQTLSDGSLSRRGSDTRPRFEFGWDWDTAIRLHAVRRLMPDLLMHGTIFIPAIAQSFKQSPRPLLPLTKCNTVDDGYLSVTQLKVKNTEIVVAVAGHA